MLPWPKVQRRIAQLIKEDRFYTEAEQDRFDNIDPIAIREALAERGIVNGQVADPEKLDNDPFIQRVMADVRISREGKLLRRNSLLPIIRVFWFQMRNTLRPVAHSGSELLTIRQSRPIMWAIPFIWMTAPPDHGAAG